MTIDGHFRYANEDERMRMLREEEAELGIQPLEYVSNAIVTARLSLHPQKAAQTSGPEAAGAASKTHPHQEPAHPPHIGESGLHELIEFASLAKVMG